MATRIQIRRGSSTDWTNANPVLAEGELGLELDTGRIKVGLGTTSWNYLDYRYSTASPGSNSEIIFNDSLSFGASSNFTFNKNTSTLKIGGVSGIGINTSTISGPSEIIIDPAAVGDNTGSVRIKGDLFVDGTQTIINSSTIELADFIVGIASTATTDLLADGAGIKIGPDNTFTYDYSNTALKSSENLNIASGKTYKINGVDVLSSNTLGSGIVNSSLTSVGTLNQLNISGVTTSNAYYIGSTQVISSGGQLQNISSLDATTTATIESAISAAPNNFTNLNVSGISTLSGVLNVGAAGTVITATIGGNVGINSTIPQSILDVNGDINSSTDVKIDGISVLTTASNDALALAIALG